MQFFLTLFAVAVTQVLFVTAAAKWRVTCIGDSITSGGGCLSESYTDLLQANLGPEFEVLNAGFSGHTMLKEGLLDGVQPASYWSTDTWTNALHSDPDIVTIMLGTNDAKYYNWEGVQQNNGDYYVLDYVDMINQLRAVCKSSTLFFLMVPPPVFTPYPFDMNGTVINEIFPSLIPKIAQSLNSQYATSPSSVSSFVPSESLSFVPSSASNNNNNNINNNHNNNHNNVMKINNRVMHVIDLHTPLSGSDMTCDRCHPTHEANVIIANTMQTAILSVMKQTQQN